MNENGEDFAGSSKGKSWERSWTTAEMRQNAHAWNLAGDSGLLKHLQEFSQTVLARTHTAEKALDSLTEEINTLSCEVSNTNNKFLCLANTQFVENRVYEDDDKETPQDEPVPEKKSKEETEAKMLQKVREALSMSVAVLDTMFEPVEIQASDSEDETESDKAGTKTLILEPHNPYINRPLPHLIGSEAFMADDYIGLGDTPSDGEEQSSKIGPDYDMEASSESDVDFTPFGANKRGRDTYSSQSSISNHILYGEGSGKESKKVKSGDNGEDADELNNEEIVEQPQTTSRQSAAANNGFAAQLAAKLDKIASPKKSTEPASEKTSSNTKTISDDLFGGIHSDDEDDSLFTGNSSLFSGRPKLFDDLDDTSNSLWGPEPAVVAPETKKTDQTISSQALSQKVGDDLFSNTMSDDEDDLFSTKTTKITRTVRTETKPQPGISESLSSVIAKEHHLKVSENKPGMATSTPERRHEEGATVGVNSGLFTDSGASGGTSSLINNDQKATKSADQTTQDKKPTGGVPMFGQANVLAGLKAKLPRRPSSSESSDSDHAESKSGTLPTSSSIFPSVEQPANESSSEHGYSSAGGGFQQSQSASMGFSSPSFTSSRLSHDDGYQTRNVLNSVSSIPAPNTLSNNDSDEDDLFSSKPAPFVSQNSNQISGGLFSDVNDDEDDLFAVGPAMKKEDKTQSSYISREAVGRNQLKEEKATEEATSREQIEKSAESPSIKPTTTTKPSSEKIFSHTEFGRNDIYSTVPPPLKPESKIKKPVSLFDDSDSGEDELLFSSASSAGSRRSQASTDLLASAAASSIEKKPLTKKGLFDDDDALFGNSHNDPDIDIFSGPSKHMAPPKSVIEKSEQLSKDSFVEEDVLVQKESELSVPDASISSSTSTDTSLPVKEPPKSIVFSDDLFADSGEDNDDLFSIKPKTGVINKSDLERPLDNADDVDDLFKNTLGTLPKPPQQIESKQAPSSGSLGKSLDEPSHESSSAALPPKPSNSSSVVGNESSLATEQKSISAAGSENENKDNSVDSKSIIEESIPKLDTQKFRKPEPPKTLNIRKETDPGLGLLIDSDDDDDLFGSSAPKVSSKPVLPPKQPPKPSVAAKPEPASILKSAVPKPNADDSPNAMDIKPNLSEVDGAVVSVSKLRDSLLAGGNGQPALKIDPRAFLPGHKLPPRRTPPKEETSDPPVSSGIKGPSAGPSTENPVGFDEPMTKSVTLPSANKDRAKLGVKRRPPSSKARREAARASVNFDQSDKESPLSPDSSSIVTDPTSAVNNSVASSNSVVSPSTDEDDLFGVPQDLPSEYGNQALPSTDIFSGAPLLSPVAFTMSEEQKNKIDENSQNVTLKGKAPSLEEKASLFLASEENDSVCEQLFPTQEFVGSEGNIPAKLEHSSPTERGSLDTQEPIGKIQSIEPSSRPNLSTQNIKENNIDPQLLPEIKEGEPLAKCEAQVGNSEISSSLENDVNKTSVNDIASGSVLDPLNKVEPSSAIDDDDELFGSEKKTSDLEDHDHSSLFPFVKKKPDNKQLINRPLFSEPPPLPSKADKPTSKADLGGLDDFEDGDLFSSTIKSGNKPIDVTSSSKGKESKTWNFSDEEDDDDDLFQSASRGASSNVSTKASSSVDSSVSSLTTPVENKGSSKLFKQPTVEVNIKKSKPLQPVPRNGLFGDEDDDNEDLFSKPSPLLKNKSKEKPSGKSILFDDDDDDDELFDSKPASSKKAPEHTKSKDPSGNSKQQSGPSKHSKEDVFDDPLMALLSDK